MKWERLNPYCITSGNYNIVKAMDFTPPRYQVYKLPETLLPGWYPSAEAAKNAIKALELDQDLSA